MDKHQGKEHRAIISIIKLQVHGSVIKTAAAINKAAIIHSTTNSCNHWQRKVIKSGGAAAL